jgi:hypothetical protein
VKITLACPSDWYGEKFGDAGDTVEVDDDRARVLLRDGRARLPESNKKPAGAAAPKEG